MKTLIKFLFILIGVGYSAQNILAQTEDCSIIPSSQSPNSSNAPCFDVDNIFQNCIPVYVKVNFHFFVKNDCSGNVSLPLDPTQVKQEDATGWANYMIYKANLDMENNLPQLNANGYNTPSSTSHCNPFGGC